VNVYFPAGRALQPRPGDQIVRTMQTLPGDRT